MTRIRQPGQAVFPSAAVRSGHSSSAAAQSNKAPASAVQRALTCAVLEGDRIGFLTA